MGDRCRDAAGVGRTWLGRAAAIALLGVSLAACKGPADQRLATGGTEEEFRASLADVVPKMTAHEKEALEWAFSEFDQPQLHAKYPDGSPRTIIRGEVQDVLTTFPAEIEALEKQATKDAPLRAELGKIVARDLRFEIEKTFFGLQAVITATVTNGSRHPVSRLKWGAALYLDGASKPVVATVLTDDYRKQGGLKPGGQYQVRFPIGFVSGDEAWTTLEIRNASTRRVVLVPVLDTVLDFGERAYLVEDPVPRIERMKATIKAAKLYADI
jgi:hypothetical protein